MADFSVELATLVFLFLSVFLSFYLTRNYLAYKEKRYLYWSIGLWMFALSDLVEVFFAFGVYSTLMAQIYLFLVAFLVVPLVFGSLAMLKSKNATRIYLVYSIITVAALAYFSFSSNPGSIVTSSVVNGNAPMDVLLASSAITFPALVILVVAAIVSYLRTKRAKVLWIVIGILVFGFGGTLYIASFPALLYYTEFIGLLMLWLGFFNFDMLRKRRR